jgi:membrane-associated protease RseP (regulator of RpoE activity)
MMNSLFFWLVMMFVFYIAYSIGARSQAARLAATRKEPAPPVPSGHEKEFESKLSPMLAITGRKSVGDVFQFEGTLRGKSEETFGRICDAFRGEPVKPILTDGESGDVRVVLLPDRFVTSEVKPQWWLHWLLFVATLATTTWAGALHAGVNLLQQPERFAVGLPYSLGFLLILGAHEMGHYLTARRYGIQVTPPFFVPVPFALGTFGAFIKIKSITPNRRSLFDVAVAGPLSGLVFAIPALLIGLRYSHVVAASQAPTVSGLGGVSVNSSVLMAVLAKISLGASIPNNDHLVLGPLAFAGWLGLVVTALNLLPIGQLDGGHMSHAMFGSRRARSISIVGMVCLFLLALFVWPGLMLWAIIVLFIAGVRDAPAANDLTPMDAGRMALGYFSFLLLALIIVPVPRALYEVIGVHSPYL